MRRDGVHDTRTSKTREKRKRSRRAETRRYGVHGTRTREMQEKRKRSRRAETRRDGVHGTRTSEMREKRKRSRRAETELYCLKLSQPTGRGTIQFDSRLSLGEAAH